MAHIAQELLLLLLDNAAAQPALDQPRRQRVLAAATLLDLAFACRIRPVQSAEADGASRLVALMGDEVGDPTLSMTWKLLARKPISASKAIGKLARRVEPALLEQLERSGELQRLQVYTNHSRPEPAWPLTNRGRVSAVRGELLAALCEDVAPGPGCAALITVLHAGAGLAPLLSLDPRGWDRVNTRAGEIASGSWVNVNSGLAEVNLAVTAAAVRSALQRS